MLLPYSSLWPWLLLPINCAAAINSPTVGFSLSLDYATASVRYPNGSYQDIAKLAGSPAFKQLMRSLPVRTYNDDAYSTAASTPPPHHNSLAANFQSVLGSVLTRVWPEQAALSEDLQRDSLQEMLGALKLVTEATTSHTVDWAAIGIPFPIFESGCSRHPWADIDAPFPVDLSFCNLIQDAAASLSMRVCTHPIEGNALAAARANDVADSSHCSPFPDSDIPDDPAHYILMVDYSHAALTALLVQEVCNFSISLRSMHRTALGAANESEASSRAIQTELRTMLRRPLMVSDELDGTESLTHLVLLGESGLDPRLNMLLKEVLDEHFHNETSLPEISSAQVDPLFASARGLAKMDCRRTEHDTGCLVQASQFQDDSVQ